jgi:hypothetical protein
MVKLSTEMFLLLLPNISPVTLTDFRINLWHDFRHPPLSK